MYKILVTSLVLILGTLIGSASLAFKKRMQPRMVSSQTEMQSPVAGMSLEKFYRVKNKLTKRLQRVNSKLETMTVSQNPSYGKIGATTISQYGQTATRGYLKKLESLRKRLIKRLQYLNEVEINFLAQSSGQMLSGL